MPFPNNIKVDALVRSRRCCCICHKFAGRNTNVHHIIQEAKGGPNSIDNAIVLCLNCHADAGHYNPEHPIGDKYSPNELRKHRDEWWEWVKDHPFETIPQLPLLITPSSAKLNTGLWRSQTILKITNKSEDPIYQIWVKTTIDSSSIDLRNIEISLVSTNMGDETQVEIADVVWDTKIVKFLGKDFAKNHALFLLINNIDPRITVTLKVTNKNLLYLPNMNVEAQFAIMDFSKHPADILFKDDQALINFTPPEDIRINGLGILIKKGKTESKPG